MTTKTDWGEAVAELAGQVAVGFAGHRCDLAVVFVHSSFIPDCEKLLESLCVGLSVRQVLGCTAAGIIGTESEVEQVPAISLLVGELPDVVVRPFCITREEMEEASGPGFWHYQLEVTPAERPNLILLGDPFTVPATALVSALGEAFPGAPLVGGLASGGQEPGVNRLFLDGEVVEEGAVGVALTGRVELRALVSQGCKPIGEPFTVTRAEKNIILELAGRPPLAVLQEMLPHLSKSDQQLAQRALVLGRVVNEYKEDYGPGDFLIRNLIGHDPESGALAVGDWMHAGQTVQFQVRDGTCADQDLRAVLERERGREAVSPVYGALLFSCLGRGEGMYGVRNHDIRLLHEYLGPLPVAGLFGNGEIGPVGGKTYVHGFTSVLGLFAEPRG